MSNGSTFSFARRGDAECHGLAPKAAPKADLLIFTSLLDITHREIPYVASLMRIPSPIVSILSSSVVCRQYPCFYSLVKPCQAMSPMTPSIARSSVCLSVCLSSVFKYFSPYIYVHIAISLSFWCVGCSPDAETNGRPMNILPHRHCCTRSTHFLLVC